MRYIVDDIGEVVGSLRQVENGPPYYLYGRRLEIANLLAAKDKRVDQSNKKYPVVALILDTPEPVVNGLVNWDLTIVIATLTKKDLTPQQRYAQYIKPILIPIYEGLVGTRTTKGAFSKGGLFVWPGNQKVVPHTPTIHYYWGVPDDKPETLRTDDPLDAIELTNLKINSTNKSLCLSV